MRGLRALLPYKWMIPYLALPLVTLIIVICGIAITDYFNAQKTALRAGPTRVMPVRNLSVSNGNIDIVYRTPQGSVRGILYNYQTGSIGAVQDDFRVRDDLVVEVEGPSEVEWYGTDNVLSLDRVKQIRLNSAEVKAMGPPVLHRN